MGYRNLLIEEKEKQEILLKYGIILEQKIGSYTTGSDIVLSPYGGGQTLTLLRGATFNISSKNKNVIIAKNVKLQFEDNMGKKVTDNTKQYISYYCDQKKFFVQNGEKPGYGSDNLASILSKKVCGFVVPKNKEDQNKDKEVNNKPISTPVLNSDGTYTIMTTQVFTISGNKLGGEPSNIYVLKNTKIVKNNDGKSVSFNAYHKENNEFKISSTKGKLTCGDYIIYIGGQGYAQEPSTGQPFKTVINRLFCDGNKLKTTEDLNKKEIKSKLPDSSKSEVPKVVNKPVKLPNLTNENFCNLPSDVTWSYAKLDDGTWYASKNKTDWFKLELPKYQKAVDILNKDAKCSKLEEVPVMSVKKAEEITPQPNVNQPQPGGILTKTSGSGLAGLEDEPLY